MQLITIHTLNSRYLIDPFNRQVMRTSGDHAPQPRQGADGEWKEFAAIYPAIATNGVALFFDWDGHGHGTITSVITEIS